MKLSGKKGTEQSKKKSVGKAKKASEVIKVPGDWLYMTPQEIGVRQIYEAFGEIMQRLSAFCGKNFILTNGFILSDIPIMYPFLFMRNKPF